MNALYTIQEPHSDLFSDANQSFDDLKATLVSDECGSLCESDVERLIASTGRELMRRLLQSHLLLRGQAEPVAPVVGADGVGRGHVRSSQPRLLETSFGTVSVVRTAFSGRHRSALHPVDADLNLPAERHSHEVQRVAVLTAAKQSYEGTTGLVTSMTAATVGKRAVEEFVRRAAADFRGFYRTRAWDAASQNGTGSLLVISVDQKGIVMTPNDLTPETRRIGEAQEHRLAAIRDRSGKDTWRGRKRMATVATVHTIRPDMRTAEEIVMGLRRLRPVSLRPQRTVRPELKRLWASVEDLPEKVVLDAFAEAKKRDPFQLKRWIVLIDGDPDLERWVKGAAESHGVKVTVVLDLIHALQYVWRAGVILCGEKSAELEGWVLHRLQRILQGKVGNVVAGISRAATLRAIKKSQRSALDKCCGYLLKRKSLMEYGDLLSWGAPIASGVIEGGCKHLINDRLQLCGARWSLEGAEAILQVRALVISGDFDEFWSYHERQEHLRNHVRRYADGSCPDLQRSQPPHRKLSLVKV